MNQSSVDIRCSCTTPVGVPVGFHVGLAMIGGFGANLSDLYLRSPTKVLCAQINCSYYSSTTDFCCSLILSKQRSKMVKGALGSRYQPWTEATLTWNFHVAFQSALSHHPMVLKKARLWAISCSSLQRQRTELPADGEMKIHPAKRKGTHANMSYFHSMSASWTGPEQPKGL